MTDTLPSDWDPASGMWLCPPDTVEWETCDPSLCPCDVAARVGYCVQDCCFANDVRYPKVCRDGEWTCESPVPYESAECSPSECPCEALMYWRGDRCDADGKMYCELSPETLAACDTIACQTCEGLDSPELRAEDCVCACREDAVWCERVDEGA